MSQERASLKPLKGADCAARKRLNLKGEFALALLPTLTILVVLALVEAISRQRLLFASLAASAFLIYLDPQHGTNSVRTLALSQMMAAMVGLAAFLVCGPGYLAAGVALVMTITLMILFDVMHPPAVATSMSFAFRAGDESNLLLFAMAVGITAVLVVLQRAALWLLARSNNGSRGG